MVFRQSDGSPIQFKARSLRRALGASWFIALASSTCLVPLAHGETLTDAIAGAYRYNPRLDAARAALRATDEEVARANSGYRPSINATADAGYQDVSTKPANTRSTVPAMKKPRRRLPSLNLKNR